MTGGGDIAVYLMIISGSNDKYIVSMYVTLLPAGDGYQPAGIFTKLLQAVVQLFGYDVNSYTGTGNTFGTTGRYPSTTDNQAGFVANIQKDRKVLHRVEINTMVSGPWILTVIARIWHRAD